MEQLYRARLETGQMKEGDRFLNLSKMINVFLKRRGFCLGIEYSTKHIKDINERIVGTEARESWTYVLRDGITAYLSEDTLDFDDPQNPMRGRWVRIDLASYSTPVDTLASKIKACSDKLELILESSETLCQTSRDEDKVRTLSRDKENNRDVISP